MTADEELEQLSAEIRAIDLQELTKQHREHLLTVSVALDVIGDPAVALRIARYQVARLKLQAVVSQRLG